MARWPAFKSKIALAIIVVWLKVSHARERFLANLAQAMERTLASTQGENMGWEKVTSGDVQSAVVQTLRTDSERIEAETEQQAMLSRDGAARKLGIAACASAIGVETPSSEWAMVCQWEEALPKGRKTASLVGVLICWQMWHRWSPLHVHSGIV